MRDRQSTPLFDAVPSYIRSRDGEEERALEALTALATEELQIVERDIDHLFDNWFVETCEPWVLAYIADLIGAQPMREISEQQAGQLRAYVANVLQYRRAKGTAAAVEQVARDVSGWSVVVVEFFKHLVTAENVNHLRSGRLTTASVRRDDEPQLAHQPFSRGSHLPAAGPAASFSGRFNIPNLGLFIWRQTAQPMFPVLSESTGYLGGPEPAKLTANGAVRRFDPLGRDLPLVNLPRPDLEIADRVSPLNVPERLRREPLADELDGIRAGDVETRRWFGKNPVIRVRLNHEEVPPEKIHCCNLAESSAGKFRQPARRGEVLVDPVLGRLSLHTNDRRKHVETGFAAPQGLDVGGGAYDRRASLTTWWDDIFIAGEPAPWRIGVSARDEWQTDDPDQGGPVVDTLRKAIQRWNSESVVGQRGIITILDSATYDQALGGAGTLQLKKGCQLVVIAADWPGRDHAGGVYRREAQGLSPSLRRPYIPTRMRIKADPSDDDRPTRLVLSGLALKDLAIAASEDLDRLDLLDCTIGAPVGEFGKALIFNGQESLRINIERCICGQLDLEDVAGTLRVTDSIIAFGTDLAGGTGKAIILPNGDLQIANSTIFGMTGTRTVEAENSIFTGKLAAAHRQQGCVRFSYLPASSIAPRRFRCATEESGTGSARLRPEFVSDSFAVPGFAELSAACAAEICEGAEGKFEMGVTFSQRVPARIANLREAVREYAPFGLNSSMHFVEG